MQRRAKNERRRYATGAELALVRAAERLFAENGIAGTSLRQVVQAADQRNMSAAHYHFGSREGLVVAVLEHRMPDINDRRAALLIRPREHGSARGLRSLVEAYVRPLAEQLHPRPEGNYYLRFLLQYRNLPVEFEQVRALAPAAASMSQEIAELLPDLPTNVVAARQLTAWTMIVSSLAEAEAKLSRGGLDVGELEFTCNNLIDMVAAAMAAPVSAETLASSKGRPGPQ